MFDRTRCDLCGECLEKCKYLDFDKEQGSREFARLIEGQAVEWLNKCITCFACNGYCPHEARPFDLIVERMEEKGDYISPELFSLARQMVTPKNEYTPTKATSKVMSLCTIYVNMPWAFQGKLFEDLTLVKGRHFFCNLMYPHIGNETLLRDGLQPLVDRYATLGVDEVVFLHDDCYSAMTDSAEKYDIKLPFKPVHIFEYLRDYLKNHPDEIQPLDMKVAYQRPCASRLTPWKDPLLDEILGLIGVERVERVYDREDSLCCGQDMHGLQPRGDKFPRFQDLNIQDAVDHGAETMLYLCPLCLDALYKKAKDAGLKNLMLSDLVRLAIGENLPQDAYAILDK